MPLDKLLDSLLRGVQAIRLCDLQHGGSLGGVDLEDRRQEEERGPRLGEERERRGEGPGRRRAQAEQGKTGWEAAEQSARRPQARCPTDLCDSLEHLLLLGLVLDQLVADELFDLLDKLNIMLGHEAEGPARAPGAGRSAHSVHVVPASERGGAGAGSGGCEWRGERERKGHTVRRVHVRERACE